MIISWGAWLCCMLLHAIAMRLLFAKLKQVKVRTWQSCDMELSKGFKWICQTFDMILSNLWHDFVKFLIYKSSPLPYNTKLKFDLDSLIGLKNSIKFQDSMPWVRCAFGNVFSSVYFGYHVFVQQLAHPMYTHLSSLWAVENS